MYSRLISKARSVLGMDGIQVGGEYDTLSGSLGTLGLSFVPPVVGTDDMIPLLTLLCHT